MIRLLHCVVGVLVFLRTPAARRSTRTQSIGRERHLAGGAVTIALGIIAAITAFVQSRLPR